MKFGIGCFAASFQASLCFMQIGFFTVINKFIPITFISLYCFCYLREKRDYTAVQYGKAEMESLTLYDWCHWDLEVHNKKSIRDAGYTCKLLMALRRCICLSASCSGH